MTKNKSKKDKAEEKLLKSLNKLKSDNSNFLEVIKKSQPLMDEYNSFQDNSVKDMINDLKGKIIVNPPTVKNKGVKFKTGDRVQHIETQALATVIGMEDKDTLEVSFDDEIKLSKNKNRAAKNWTSSVSKFKKI